MIPPKLLIRCVKFITIFVNWVRIENLSQSENRGTNAGAMFTKWMLFTIWSHTADMNDLTAIPIKQNAHVSEALCRRCGRALATSGSEYDIGATVNSKKWAQTVTHISIASYKLNSKVRGRAKEPKKAKQPKIQNGWKAESERGRGKDNERDGEKLLNYIHNLQKSHDRCEWIARLFYICVWEVDGDEEGERVCAHKNKQQHIIIGWYFAQDIIR